ncbi:MAG: hypothetical protein LBB11_03010 [Puniceicoccales bacterium]|jgi:ribose 5-phosphate isomerase RpiB|nr:hypothetical protein [Puniceicoccales bacterium]
MCIAGETMTCGLLEDILKIFFDTDFEGGQHERRLSKIVEFEFSRR